MHEYHKEDKDFIYRNSERERVKLNELTPDTFKCFNFMHRLMGKNIRKFVTEF